MTTADHQIVTVEVERLDHHRKERQILPVKLTGLGEPLHPGATDPVLFDPLGHAALDVNQRIDRRVRIELADRFEHFLSATHPSEPVVDDGDAHSPSTSP